MKKRPFGTNMNSKYHQERKRNYIRACMLTRSVSGSEYNFNFLINVKPN